MSLTANDRNTISDNANLDGLDEDAIVSVSAKELRDLLNDSHALESLRAQLRQYLDHLEGDLCRKGTLETIIHVYDHGGPF